MITTERLPTGRDTGKTETTMRHPCQSVVAPLQDIPFGSPSFIRGSPRLSMLAPFTVKAAFRRQRCQPPFPSRSGCPTDRFAWAFEMTQEFLARTSGFVFS